MDPSFGGEVGELDDEVGRDLQGRETRKRSAEAPLFHELLAVWPRRSAFDGLSDLGRFGDLNRIGFRSAVGRR